MAMPAERPRAERGPQPLLGGRYRLEERLGAGGFGTVWRARDERLEREVAVKVVPRPPGGGRRVEREARAAARLNHPAIVALYELAADEQDLVLVSELVRGRTLADLEREGPLSDRDVARVGAELCDALEHAHARGVIHRDVKPQNVMVVAAPALGAGFAKLTDFGVAHVRSGDEGDVDALTRTGDVVGTLAYMAPEQAEGRRVTPACDVYSLALTLYEAWTGTNPVRAAGPAATVRRLGRPLPSLARRRRDLPAGLCDVVDDALEPDPELRPSPAELREELRAAEPLLDDDGGLVEPGTLEQVRLGARRAAGVLGRGRPAGSSRVPPGVGRIGAGLAAGALVLLALNALGPEAPGFRLVAAGLAAAVVAALPRAGWVAAAAGTCLWLASPAADRPGTALLLAAALAPVPLLLPRAGRLWSLPVLAPLLGLAGLAAAFPALAALAPTAWRRAGLAAGGFLWLLTAEVLTGRSLLFGAPEGVLPRAEWQGSLTGAAADALLPLAGSPALPVLLAWAAFAPLLPLLVRGRYPGLDAIGAVLWAAGLAAAHVALGAPRASLAGPLLGALAVVAAASIAAPGADPDTVP